MKTLEERQAELKARIESGHPVYVYRPEPDKPFVEPVDLSQTCINLSSSEAAEYTGTRLSEVRGMITRDTLARIAGDAIAGAGLEFTGEVFRSVRRPGVYLFLLGKQALYIGVSKGVMSRAAYTRHKQAQQAASECDRVLIYPCEDMDAALRLESMLILALKPKYNVNKQLNSADISAVGLPDTSVTQVKTTV